MFCAIATTIERCKTEGVVDVFQVVKALRAQKPGAVRTVVRNMLAFSIIEYVYNCTNDYYFFFSRPSTSLCLRP